jgi:3-isopropylmalate/(R)-2-methylmalate dehydratase large subunit
LSDGFSLTGRVLVLCESPEVLQAQLKGSGRAVDLAAAGPLRQRVSTDEITPAWAEGQVDASPARYCLVGLAGEVVEPGALEAAGFQVLVAGEGFGCGPAHETAALALRDVGIRLIVARGVDESFLQQCQNLGIYVTGDFGVLGRLLQAGSVPTPDLLRGLDGLSRDVVEAGGLFAYGEGRLAGRIPGATVTGNRRPMTLAEKLIAAHVVRPQGLLGVPSVTPGQSYFVRTDLRLVHDAARARTEALFREGFAGRAAIADPDSLVLLGEQPAHDAEAPTHDGDRAARVVEQLGLPGGLIVATGSLGNTAGALGALAFGIGRVEMAAAFLTRDVRLRVPETVRIELTGQLRQGLSAEHAVLALLASREHQTGMLRGRVLEFVGPGVSNLSLDERAVLASLAPRASAFAAIVAFDKRARLELAERRGGDLDLPLVGSTSDADAQFAATVQLSLASVTERNAT